MYYCVASQLSSDFLSGLEMPRHNAAAAEYWCFHWKSMGLPEIRMSTTVRQTEQESSSPAQTPADAATSVQICISVNK